MTRLCLEALAEGGELVFAAMGRFGLYADDIGNMMSKNQSLKGFALLPLLTRQSLKADLADLFERALDNRLKVLPGEAFPLDQAAEAHRALESRRTTGKVALLP